MCSVGMILLVSPLRFVSYTNHCMLVRLPRKSRTNAAVKVMLTVDAPNEQCGADRSAGICVTNGPNPPLNHKSTVASYPHHDHSFIYCLNVYRYLMVECISFSIAATLVRRGWDHVVPRVVLECYFLLPHTDCATSYPHSRIAILVCKLS